MRATRTRPDQAAGYRGALNKLVARLQHVETTNVCVQTSIGVLGALADPARWNGLIADGFEAAREASDDELVALYQEILEELDK